MQKSTILQKYSNPEDKFLISKVLDKLKFSETRNQITNTNFMDVRQKNLIINLLQSLKYSNYFCYGGFDNAERTIFIFYPEKLSENIVMENIDNIIKCINIKLPKELLNTYTHRNYLGGIMKLGIEREKIGDILVSENGANIITCTDIAKSLTDLLANLKRFSKSIIDVISTKSITSSEIKKEEITIIVPSLRLDSIVADLAHTSRNKALEIISSERVLVNFETVIKNSKLLNYGDIVTIRGKGRFEIVALKSTSKNGNLIVLVNKFL